MKGGAISEKRVVPPLVNVKTKSHNKEFDIVDSKVNIHEEGGLRIIAYPKNNGLRLYVVVGTVPARLSACLLFLSVILIVL